MPGIGEAIEGAMQHAPHPTRQFMIAAYQAAPRIASAEMV
jgi:hypothetical protein